MNKNSRKFMQMPMMMMQMMMRHIFGSEKFSRM